MDDLKKAIEIRRKYNKMPFDEFIKEFESYSGEKISEEIKESFIFTDLSNVDFFAIHIDI